MQKTSKKFSIPDQFDRPAFLAKVGDIEEYCNTQYQCTQLFYDRMIRYAKFEKLRKEN